MKTALKDKIFPALGILLPLVLLALNETGNISSYIVFVVMVGMCNIILTLSLNLITGITGQFSLGHAGFMAIGAYSSAYLSKAVFSISAAAADNPVIWATFALCVVCGGLFAGLTAYLLGMIILRLTGDYLCIATLGFTQIVVVALNNIAAVGGPRGYYGIPKLSNLWIVTLFTWCSTALLARYIKSAKGRACEAILEDEIAAESLGIYAFKTKLHSFAIGCFFAGVAGALLAHLVQLAHPSQYSFVKSIEILLMVVVGGMGSIKGSVAAAFILTFIPEILRFSQDLRLVLYPLLLIIFVSGNPEQYAARFWAFITAIRKREPRGSA